MIRKSFLYVLLIVFAIASVLVFSYYSDIDSPADKKGAPLKFVVASGDSVGAIGGKLLSSGLIKSEFHFKVYVWQTKKSASMQAGTYELSPKMTIKELVGVLAAGKTVNAEKEITIIPGWTLIDIADYLQVKGISSKENFYNFAGEPKKKYALNSLPDYSAEYSFLADKPKNVGLEGYLFPDTYRIFNDATVAVIIDKMLSDLDGKITAEMRAEIKKQGKTIYEIITMASVIEKEVRKEEDMKIVSGIFWGRIKSGQGLESCATLAYILGKNKPIYTIDDTRIESPYNTYRHQSLPPGPISNPSLAAIKAAIYPTITDYNYFLSRPDTGATVFSKTLDEHNRNKQKYLK